MLYYTHNKKKLRRWRKITSRLRVHMKPRKPMKPMQVIVCQCNFLLFRRFTDHNGGRCVYQTARAHAPHSHIHRALSGPSLTPPSSRAPVTHEYEEWIIKVVAKAATNNGQCCFIFIEKLNSKYVFRNTIYYSHVADIIYLPMIIRFSTHVLTRPILGYTSLVNNVTCLANQLPSKTWGEVIEVIAPIQSEKFKFFNAARCPHRTQTHNIERGQTIILCDTRQLHCQICCANIYNIHFFYCV